MQLKELKEHLENLNKNLVEQRDRAEAIFDQLSERADEVESWLFDLEDYEDASDALEDTVSTLEGVLEALKA